MTWLIFFYALTLGAEQSDMLVGYDPSLIWYGYSQLETSILIADTLELGGSTTIRLRPSHVPFFSPVEAEFIFFAELQYRILAVGYEHACYHNFQGYYTRDLMGYNRLYLRISNDNR